MTHPSSFSSSWSQKECLTFLATFQKIRHSSHKQPQEKKYVALQHHTASLTTNKSQAAPLTTLVQAIEEITQSTVFPTLSKMNLRSLNHSLSSLYTWIHQTKPVPWYGFLVYNALTYKEIDTDLSERVSRLRKILHQEIGKQENPFQQKRLQQWKRLSPEKMFEHFFVLVSSPSSTRASRISYE